LNAMLRLTSTTKRLRVPAVEHRRVALCAYTALAEMANGTARRAEWQDLSDSVNIVEALRAMGRYDPDGDDVERTCQTAIDGLLVAIKCPEGQMRMGERSGHIGAMRRVVELHDEAIGKFSRGTMYAAWELVQQRIYDPNGNESNGLYVVNA
jgi:hypothetical protein